MRALVQRVTEAWVDAPDDADVRAEVGRIGPGLVALVGVTRTDGVADAERLAGRLAHLRVFHDADGAMNRSVLETGGAVLVVSQFTLYADTRKGRRPSFVAAAAPDVAEPLIDHLVVALRALGVPVATGRFRTHMRVGLIKDGPVTLLVES
jgi:D-tyrosyl-tRNA(Tyr) deacylase